MNLQNAIRKVIPGKLKNLIIRDLLVYGNLSYSQEGEDILLSRIFEGKRNGFYIDIGAHHPERFSNTMVFYKKGWRGINIDAMPGSMDIFAKKRPNDINLELSISDEEKAITYHIFNEPALNTFSKSSAEEFQKNPSFFVVDKTEITTCRLETVLDKYLLKGQKIDFLTIDVEGLDLNVLKSNNWQKYSPDIVLVEIFGVELKVITKSNIFLEMEKNGYTLIAKTLNTAIFRLNN